MQDIRKNKPSTYRKHPRRAFPIKILEKTVLPTMRRLRKRLASAASAHGVDRARARLLAEGFLKVMFGFLMGTARLPQSVRPLGLAAVCSFADAKSVLCVYAGVALSCLFAGLGGLPYFVLTFFLYVGRKAFTDSRFSEPLYARVLESAAVSAAIGVLRIYAGRAEPLYEYAAFLSLAAVSCGFTVFFSTLFVPQISEKAGLGTRSVCLYAVTGALVCALNGWHVAGLDIRFAAACVCTLYFAAAGGFMHAGIVGFVCGLACFSTGASAALGLAGMVAAFLLAKSIPAALASFVATVGVCTVYGQGLAKAPDAIAGALCGAVLFVPLCGFLPDVLRLQGAVSYPKNGIKDMKTCEKEVSEAFFALSEVFSTLAEKRKYPSSSDVSTAVDKSFCEVCAGCALNEMCYARRKTDMDELKESLFAVLSCRACVREDFGELMRDKCIRLDSVCEEVNRAYRRLAEMGAADNRTAILSSQYAGMARVITDASERTDASRSRDGAFEKSVANAFKKADIPFSGVVCLGGRRKRTRVYGINLDKFPFGAEEFKRYMLASCGVYVSEPSFDISEKGGPLLYFERAPLFAVEYAYADEPLNASEPNGDTVSFVSGKQHTFYASICDGMGSGIKAASASRLSAVFLEKLLAAGIKRGVILELLNTVLLSQSGEHFSTVDLFEADLLNGRCSFIKAGAAPTYIFRGGKLYKIASATPPVGILNSFTAESTRFDVQPGDLIFMLSDGVVQGSDDGVWLAELVRMDKTGDVSRLAEDIIRRAHEINERADDASAAVIRIKGVRDTQEDRQKAA